MQTSGPNNDSKATPGFPLLDCREEIVRYFRHKSLSAEDTEDLTQETYSRYLAAYGSTVKSLPQARAILFTVARNLCHDFFRRKSHQLEVPLNPDEGVYDSAATTQDAPDPERLLIAAQELEFIQKKLMSLPKRQRRIFLLRRVEGLKYKEIARQCGTSVSLVEKEVAEALAALLAVRKKGFLDDER